MNNYSGCNPDNCPANPYTSFSLCITEPFSNNPLKSGTGSEQVLLLKENCYWRAGRYYADCNSCPIEFHPEIFLGHFNLPDENKFIILGRAEELRSAYTGGAIHENFQGRSVFFDFDISRQKRNFFYKLSFRGVGMNMAQPNAVLGLAVNKVFPGGLIWSGNNYNTTSIRNKIVQTIPANNFDYNIGAFNIYIEEEANGIVDGDSGPNDGLDSYFHQIALNLGSPLGGGLPPAEPILDINSLFMMDYLDFDCDIDNIVFRPLISRCSLSQSTNCNELPYCVEIVTDCPNINYDAYPYQIVVSNNNNTRTFAGTGRYTQIYMDDMPAGNYTLQLVYNTSTGKNIKVKEYEQHSYEAMVDFVHTPVTEYAILNNTTFNAPIYVAKNMVVYNGATLTINNAAYFNENASLIVENGGRLLVQGLGHLTACTTLWPGVNVKSQGRVQIINNGTISKANNGVYSNGNGAVISCQNAHFIDNFVGVKAIGGVSPTFLNTNFIGGSQGVYLVNVTGGTTPNGVLFEGNSFSYQSEQGIMSWNTGINVGNGNQFTGCDEGISMRNLFGNSQQSIIGGSSGAANTFTNCGKGVYSNNSVSYLYNNVFTNNNNATWLSGNNKYESEFNSFSGGYTGELLVGTGANTNFSHNNSLSSTFGIRTFFDNDQFTFLRNCFYSGNTDVQSYGTISGAQGNELVAASNCFTGGFVQDFDCNTSNQVLYYLPLPTVSYPVCLEPITSGTYIPKYLASNYVVNSCGSSLSLQNINEYDYIKAMNCDSTGLANLMMQLKSQVTALLLKKKNGTITSAESATLAWMQRHLHYAVHQWAWCLRKAGRYAELYTFYKAQDGKEYTVLAVEVKVLMGLYDAAAGELLETESIHQLPGNVMDAILLNIEYGRTDRAPRSFTSSDINLLREVAASSNPFAAYGRALLYRLTGEKVEPNTVGLVTPRKSQNKDVKAMESYRISPNPANDILKIEIQGYDYQSDYKYEILDISGRTLLHGTLIVQREIDISVLNNGVCFLKVLKDMMPVHLQKIVITD
ncbi:MAG: T9SS type A sorting domain-containing protein [Saprospiraceae bacterium]|nr:T9SS type A sorting domain-containing protein [Saprospiraceae bacterium]